MGLDLSIAVGDRDLNRPLLNGTVEPDGVDATVFSEYPPRRHRRFFHLGDHDVSEVSLASYLASRAAPQEYPFTAIPAFPAKRFRHSFCFVHDDADIDEPADLAGKKVGVQSWQTTASVWMRGILQEHHGLDLSTVTWYRRKEDDIPVELPDRFDVRTIPGPQGGDAVVEPDDFREMFLSGDLAAAMDPANPMLHAAVAADDAGFLFEDPLAAERDYYRETGLHPIMHTVAIRDEVLEAHPWVAVNLLDAFRASRDRCLERKVSPAANTSLTWSHLHRIEQRDLLGEDAWEYGLTDRTQAELETFLEYAADQGIVPERYPLEDLFVDCSVRR